MLAHARSMSMSRSPPWLRSKFELDVTGFRGTRRERDWDELGLAGVEVASALPASSVRRHLCGRRKRLPIPPCYQSKDRSMMSS